MFGVDAGLVPYSGARAARLAVSIFIAEILIGFEILKNSVRKTFAFRRILAHVTLAEKDA